MSAQRRPARGAPSAAVAAKVPQATTADSQACARPFKGLHEAGQSAKPGMTVLSAAQIGDVAREQLLAQRRKPQAPPPADAGVSSVTELTLAGRDLTDVEELGFFTELR